MISGLLAGVLWGLDTLVLGVFLSRYFDEALLMAPLISTFLHDTFSSLWMALFTAVRRQWPSVLRALKTRSGRFIVLGALLGGPVGMTGYVFAIKYLGPSYTAIISSMYPALTVFFSYIFLKEKMSTRQMLGLAISLVGVVLLNLTPGGMQSENVLIGLVCVTLACLGWSLEGVIVSYGLQGDEVTDEEALQIRQLTSALVYGLIILPLVGGWAPALETVALGHYWLAVVAALCGTASYLFYYRAIFRLGASKAVALNITYVAWLVIFSTVFLQTPLDAKTLVLGAVVVLGSLAAAMD